jgi:hypothetical protein
MDFGSFAQFLFDFISLGNVGKRLSANKGQDKEREQVKSYCFFPFRRLQLDFFFYREEPF